MKIKLFCSLFLLLFVQLLNAQIEVLRPVNANPSLNKYILENLRNGSRDFLVDKNIIFTSDTLPLPFIDDFSTITTREYDYTMSLAYDSTIATGPCLNSNAIPQTDKILFIHQPYQYFYDTTLDVIDSFLVTTSTSSYRYYGGTSCFTSFSNLIYWPPYYRYTAFEIHSDSSNYGLPIDSQLVVGDTTIGIAKIYFKNLSANSKWIDNYAWINNCFPINPPSIGVATLDGLNQFGRPYDNASPFRYGSADYLTSKPINLAGLTDLDSVYISFYYQPMGLGDYPNKFDSIIVDIKDQYGDWYPFWFDTGYSSSIGTPNDKFLLANIYINDGTSSTDPNPFYNGFQFRIRNKASLAGNNDHWNIDYVRVDRNRNLTDTLINDIAVINKFPSILKNYSMMPYKQYRGNADLDTFVNMTVRNLNTTITPTVDFAFKSDELNTSTSVYNTPTLSFTAGSIYSDRNIDPRSNYTSVSPVLTNIDMNYKSSFQTAPTSSNLITTNDTVYSNQVFDNLLAYDCNCPVKGYGLEGIGLKKFAYEYNLNAPDTLAGIQILFTSINVDVDNLIFSIYAWDSISLYGGVTGKDSIITKINLAKPNYVDSITGWSTYKFSSPVLVHNKFYIGWSQTDTRNLQIGFDLTSPKGKEHMFIYTDGEWRKSTISANGSPMMRAILDGNYQGTSTFVEEKLNIPTPTFSIYPNPTTNFIYIVSAEKEYEYSLLNTMGQNILSGSNKEDNRLSLDNLQTGIYYLQVYSKGIVKTFKIVKQ